MDEGNAMLAYTNEYVVEKNKIARRNLVLVQCERMRQNDSYCIIILHWQ